MMPFQPVLLWSDALIWLLVSLTIALGFHIRKTPHLRSAWVSIGRSTTGVSTATLLGLFVLIALLDSLHYRPLLPNTPASTHAQSAGSAHQYGVEVLSLLDSLASPLRTQLEKTYSAPFATRLYAKETQEVPGIGTVRDYPRLKFGGQHLGERENEVLEDVLKITLRSGTLAFATWTLLVLALGHQHARGIRLLYPTANQQQFAWHALLYTLLLIFLAGFPLLSLCTQYHVFGTDKVGQDVFYQVLKSLRTGLVIGLLTTLITLPIAIALGIMAGYFRGWVDDLIQYLYTVLNAIPGVLLIAAATLMMQVIIDTHPQWFSTAAERADLRLLSLCLILGMTSWTGLCRLLRGEALKLRELEYIQAAHAFGVPHRQILTRHILPNVMHIVIIALVMDFSGLVLAEAVLSYVGIGVDPTMTSFGTMINNARMELGREPVVWWSLAGAFITMFLLVLAANLFADVVRDAFDPRSTR